MLLFLLPRGGAPELGPRSAQPDSQRITRCFLALSGCLLGPAQTSKALLCLAGIEFVLTTQSELSLVIHLKRQLPARNMTYSISHKPVKKYNLIHLQ